MLADRPTGQVTVVIPARDEAARIGACLASVAAAARLVPVPVAVLVVADSCTDSTAALAARHGAEVLEVAVGNAGAARAAGCDRALAGGTDGLWLAHTDADSTVPAGWLAAQLAGAQAGADVLAGEIVVDNWRDWPAELGGRYRRVYRHERRQGVRHVHGANLGLSAWAYRTVGGFPPVPVGEDRALVTAAEAAGLTVWYPAGAPVTTSGRRVARVSGGGFHDYLRRLARC